jgi:excisionase family DNA binding protein
MPDIDHGPVTLGDLDGRDFGEVWEISEILGADPRTIRAQCREGTIPSVKIGREYRIPLAWLRAASAGSPG